MEAKKKLLVGILLVGLLLTCMPVMAKVNTQSTMALSVSVEAPDEAKTNALNEAEITLKNTASYPVKARTVIKPSYFALKPEWFDVDAMEDGSGVTFTTEVPANSEKEIEVTIPGNVLEGLNTEGELRLFKEVKAYPFAGSSAEAQGVSSKNLETVSVDAPTSQWEGTADVFNTVIFLFVGGALVFLGFSGTKYAK